VIFEGLVPTARRILAEESFKGFYRGMGVNLLRTVPSSAVTLLVYEKIMQSLLRRTHPEDYDEEGRKVK
jgi:solute carrier family 25 folate transporter 32